MNADKEFERIQLQAAQEEKLESRNPTNYHVSFPHPFSHSQLAVLLSIAETFFSAFSDSEVDQLLDTYVKKISSQEMQKDKQILRKFLQLELKSMNFFDGFMETLLDASCEDQLFQMNIVLKILSTGIGSYLLCGGGRRVPFYELNLSEKEAALLYWSNSNFKQIRGLFKSLKSIVLLQLYSTSSESEIISKALGWKKEDGYSTTESKEEFVPTFFEEFFSKDESNMYLKADIAAELSKLGLEVLVLEKGEYYQPSLTKTYTEKENLNNFYEKKGALITDDYSLMVVSSTFGGGSVVNWSASLGLPYSVRAEWANKFKLPYFLSKDYQDSLNIIYARIGVTTKGIIHNASNQILIDGCKKLGYHYEDIPQNTAGSSHKCGSCIYGCSTGEKQSAVLTWLKDAQQNGVKFIKNCTVTKIITKKGKASGVVCFFDKDGKKKKLFIKSPIVVVSGGSFNTPALLLKSGLHNKHIGQNLRLHPVTLVNGKFDKKIKQNQGSIMTAISKNASNADGNGYGAAVEVMAYTPALYGTVNSWKSRSQHKLNMTTFDSTCALLVLTRDYDSVGTVTLDKTGNARINYSLSPHDEESMFKGAETAINILIAEGASEISTTQQHVENFIIEKDDKNIFTSAKYLNFINKVKTVGFKPNSAFLGSAHQMSSCRLSCSPDSGVCKPSGETWEIKNLYVADASLFPTASGVNPMITTYSVAYMVAQNILKRISDSKL
ncbi:hypothetical protein HK099_004112 [Clydaea vesicula]|uniref:Long-chain-alcohol oxidase n=1 Tax=Clydaea vesicula TaxID=447962 RepID=A0AAD5XVU8_9FUNG|nr:hypothetical protein HK099_004112 [Clydaea vesicula]